MDFDFSILLRFKGALAFGLWTTLQLTVVSLALGVILGFMAAVGRGVNNPVIRVISSAYVELFRGTPVLVQLFWIFFCLPLILGVELSNFTSSVIALTLYMGAISSETFRASLRSIEPEQMDACIALGLPVPVRIRYVILPQAILRAIPMLLSNGISLFKESALVSTVGMADLMFVGQNISNNTARPVEVLTVVALIYFVVAFPLTRAVTSVERRVLKRLAI